MLRSPGHFLSIVFWALFLINFLAPFAGIWGEWVLKIGFVLFAFHAVECIVFAKRIKAADGSALHHIVMILIYGIFHGRTLPRAR